MSCPVTGFTEISASTIKPPLRPDPAIGTKVTLYDQSCIWTSEHLTPTQLNRLRNIGDPVIDHFFDMYGQEFQTNDDTYAFLEQLHRQNPEHICNESCQDGCIINFVKNIRQRPIWFNQQQIEIGQKFFLKYSPIPVATIFSYTLILGYGFQQLNDVLIKTQYLSSPDLSETYCRLVETFQMIYHATTGDIDNFDQTFLDVIRVRLLHGMVRYKFKKAFRSNSSEIPINQEDSLITLLGFSFAVLQCMEERIGITISMEDKLAYLHLWRYIGWLIGINDEYLQYFSSYKLTRTISESIFYHYYLPSQTSKHLVHHSLKAVYLNTTLPLSLKFHIGLSQRLLGNAISKALDIDQPAMDLLHSYIIDIWFCMFRFFAWLISLNYRSYTEWIIKNNKKGLHNIIQLKLNKQLRNFSLYKTYDTKSKEIKSVKHCPCGYYQKKHHGMIKTYDIGIIRCLQPFSLTSVFKTILLAVGFVFLN